MPFTIGQMALMLFLVSNPFGNIPIFMSLVKDFNFPTQKKILRRECFFSFLIACFFLFVGKYFLGLLGIELYAIEICGGLLLLIIASSMLFPLASLITRTKLLREPYIFPMATPLITGGGALALIIILSEQVPSTAKIFLSLLIAWCAMTLVVTSGAYLARILGRRGLHVLQFLMGMILTLIALEIIMSGAELFRQILTKGLP
jgi:multiple antibiotic resistance protein